MPKPSFARSAAPGQASSSLARRVLERAFPKPASRSQLLRVRHLINSSCAVSTVGLFQRQEQKAAYRRRGDRLLRAITIALRVVIGVVALNLSGMSGLASPIGLSAADDCCTDCPIEQSGKECPPACPVCHCAHGNIALPTSFEKSTEPPAPLERSADVTPYEASVSSAPQLPGVFRPPRTTSSST